MRQYISDRGHSSAAVAPSCSLLVARSSARRNQAPSFPHAPRTAQKPERLRPTPRRFRRQVLFARKLIPANLPGYVALVSTLIWTDALSAYRCCAASQYFTSSIRCVLSPASTLSRKVTQGCGRQVFPSCPSSYALPTNAGFASCFRPTQEGLSRVYRVGTGTRWEPLLITSPHFACRLRGTSRFREWVGFWKPLPSGAGNDCGEG